MTLTADDRRASRELGLVIDGAIAKRLALHGFHGAGFGCVARGMEPPRSISSALAVCIDEAAEPVDGSGAEGGPEADQEVAEHQGEAGEVHGPTVAPPSPVVEVP